MEVHAHSHTARKKWTHYLWEFLMLFLAVFCGFLAEYQLEHKIEKDREQQYIQSLIEDLETDTTNLGVIIDVFINKDKDVDTLLMLFPQLVKGYNEQLYLKLNAVRSFPDFIKADRTMQQLKNSGGMRLIRNKKAADAITDYDLINRNLDLYTQSLGDAFSYVKMSRYEIFNTEALENDLKIKTIAELQSGKENYLLKTDKQSLGKFNNEIRGFKTISQLVLKKEEKIRDHATALIKVLKKEYYLE
jgi:hypothetical protein